MKREEGYYWVKRNREWFVAEYRQCDFEEFESDQRAFRWLDTKECSYEESELDEINEHQILPPEG